MQALIESSVEKSKQPKQLTFKNLYVMLLFSNINLKCKTCLWSLHQKEACRIECILQKDSGVNEVHETDSSESCKGSNKLIQAKLQNKYFASHQVTIWSSSYYSSGCRSVWQFSIVNWSRSSTTAYQSAARPSWLSAAAQGDRRIKLAKTWNEIGNAAYFSRAWISIHCGWAFNLDSGKHCSLAWSKIIKRKMLT